MAVFVTLLSGCAIYEGQRPTPTTPSAPHGSLVISAPSAQFSGLVKNFPELAQVLHERGLDPQKAAKSEPLGRVVCVVSDSVWPAQVEAEDQQCRSAMAVQVQKVEQECAARGGYPAQLTAACPVAGQVHYQQAGGEFELTCEGPHHHSHYSSLTGFDAPPKVAVPECALATQAPEPHHPWYVPWGTAHPPLQLVSGDAQLLAGPGLEAPADAAQARIQLRSALATRWLPEELQGSLRGSTYVDLSVSLETGQGTLRAYGTPSEAPAASCDLEHMLGQLPDAPVAMVYDRGFARSLGLHLDEPVAFDPAAGELLKQLGAAASGWVGCAAQLDLAVGESRHERGRLWAGRAAAVALLPEAFGGAKASPDLQIQESKELNRVGLGHEPDAPAGAWTAPGPTPGAPGAAGWITASLSPSQACRLRWVAGRDALGLWVVFDADAQGPAAQANVPTGDADVQVVYHRHPTVLAGR